jgi:elongation factor Ts
MEITSQQIKLLREKTGAGMLNCKNALIETKGDSDKAIILLREKGLISAQKKQQRATKQGIITSYIHIGSKIGVLLELNCETDFVARRSEFQTLGRNIAMQIASGNSITYISSKDIPQEIWDSEMEIESKKKDLKEKPEHIKQIILKGRVEKNLEDLTLLNQTYIRDPELTVEEYIKNHVSLLGENIQINRFCKFIVGENEKIEL